MRSGGGGPPRRELGGIADGQRVKDQRVEDGENGGVGADAEGQREDDERATKSGLFRMVRPA